MKSKRIKTLAIETFKGPLLSLREFLTIESPLKMMKSTFYFIIKVIFLLDIFTILSSDFGCLENWLHKRIMANFKFITSQTQQQVITIHI